jgi:hypothetical protein
MCVSGIERRPILLGWLPIITGRWCSFLTLLSTEGMRNIKFLHALHSHEKHLTHSIKSLEGVPHPSKVSGATPDGCARAHPLDRTPLEETKI